MKRRALFAVCMCLLGTLSCQTVPPRHPDWSQVVTATPDGGYLMGNPNARIALVEFASMTSPQSASFDEEGYEKLIDQHVKSGRVSFEFRNYARDPFDVSASLISRCAGPERFFQITHTMFVRQREWLTRLLEFSEDQLKSLQAMNPERQYLEIAEMSGLLEWAAEQGLTPGQTTACLSDKRAADELMKMSSAAISKYPDFPGLPSFAINGSLSSESTWEAIEAKLKSAR